jgi:PAS domain S-box-containing protein
MAKPAERPKDHRRMSKPELAERLAALQDTGGSDKELQTVLHELEVYQIELEMQVRELRESREALEESHNRYANLYDFAPVGYVTLSDHGMIQEINLTAASLLGIERRWLLDRSLSPWILPPDLAVFRSHLKQCRENGGKVKSSLRLVRRDKSAIPVELLSSYITDPITGAALFRSAITDLTDRKKAEADLDRFFNLSSDLICTVGTDGYFKRVNPAFERTLGYSVQELLSRPAFDFVHPDDREDSQAVFHRLAQDGASAIDYQNRYMTRDRAVLWLSWSTITSGDTLYCVARDITAKVNAREMIANQHNWLKEMVEGIPIPLFVMETATGAIVSMSKSRTDIEMSQSDTLLADRNGRKLPPEKWPRARAARGEELNNEQYIWRMPDRTLPVLISSRNIAEKFGRPAMTIIAIQDVSQLKKMEKFLHELVEKLEQERDLRERFVSTLTHDLRTPLTAARLNAQLLELSLTDPAPRLRAAGQVIRNIDRIDQMIGNLLDANRIRAGEKLPLNFTHFDLVHLVKSTLDDLSVVYRDRLILLPNEGPVVGTWSENGLRRVIENLASNAIKYGATGQPITVSIDTPSAEKVVVSVHNQGNPIPKEDQLTLFDQFRRTSSADRGDQKGWGLGLTLVKGTVEAHGGEVSVESDWTHGTTFRVMLPLASSAIKET